MQLLLTLNAIPVERLTLPDTEKQGELTVPEQALPGKA